MERRAFWPRLFIRMYRAKLRKVRIADILGEPAADDNDGSIDARRCAFLQIRERRQAAS
jgi:hypothetical protein